MQQAWKKKGKKQEARTPDDMQMLMQGRVP
jgi:hypothetical protein